MAFNFSPKVITNGLVYYNDYKNTKCYSQGSTIYDLSRNEYTGTSNGPSYASGEFSFDGTNDFISLTNTINLGNNFTISINFKLSNNNNDTILLGCNANGSDNWIGIYQDKPTVFVTQSADINNLNVISNVVLEYNRYYNFTATVSPNLVNIYLDNSLIYSASTGFSIGQWNGNFCIGRRSSVLAEKHFNGSIRNLLIYNRVLNSQERTINYGSTRIIN